MPTPAEQTHAVSDPGSPEYDRDSPHYDVTADSSSPFYIGPIAEGVRSGDEIRAEVTNQVDAQIATFAILDHPLLAWVLTLTRDGQIQDRYSDAIAESRDGLGSGLDLRDAGTAPKTLWANASHEQMVTAISEQADSVTVAESSEEWVRLGTELTGHQESLGSAINDSLADWQGSGGDAAREHLAGVGRWLGATAQGATLAGRQQQIHSQTLNETQKQMDANPPVPFSAREANARLQTITDPLQYARQASVDMQAFQEQQAAREQASRIMTQFDDTIAGATTTPAFAAPPSLDEGVVHRAETGGGGASGWSRPAEPSAAAAPGAGGWSPAKSGTPSDPLTPLSRSIAPQSQDGSVPTGPPTGPNAPRGVPAAGTEPVPGGGAPTPGGGVPPLGGNRPSPPAVPSLGPDAAPEGAAPFTDRTNTSGYAPPTGPGGSPSVPPIPDDIQRGTGPSRAVPPVLPGISGPGPQVGPTGRRGGGTGKVPTFEVPKDGGTPRGPNPGVPRIPGPSGFGPLGGGPNPSSTRIPGGPGTPGGSGVPAGPGSGPGASGGGRFPAGPGGGPPGAASGGARFGSVPGEPGSGGPRVPGAAEGGARGGTHSGMPMGGAGGGRRGEDDNEHRAADYLEGDQDIFAADQVIAPPVIGDWTNKDWK